MTTNESGRDYDIAVLGGGLVGSAVAWGLARVGQRVAVLDEGDIAFRASRGNFALVWVQSKGLGMPEYARWTVQSAGNWPSLSDELREQTGLDLKLEQRGGFHLVLSEREWTHRIEMMTRLAQQPGMPDLQFEMMDHARVKQTLPEIGPEVVGASFCALDGHVNSLRLFRALNEGMQKFGVAYLPLRKVEQIVPLQGGGFRFDTSQGEVRAAKVVLTAGIGNAHLAPMVGLSIPVRPQRGQVIVTEKTKHFLDYPVTTLRQTDEGGVMLGDSQEEAVDPVVGMPVLSVLADRARRMFPRLGSLNVVRSWAALRVMTQDGFPIYDQSETMPGAFCATCHSGVTLAANHALELAPLIASGHLPAETFKTFSSRRFDVQKTS